MSTIQRNLHQWFDVLSRFFPTKNLHLVASKTRGNRHLSTGQQTGAMSITDLRKKVDFLILSTRATPPLEDVIRIIPS